MIFFSYTDNDKVKAGPSTCEISPQSKGNPLEGHLNGEENSKHHVDNF